MAKRHFVELTTIGDGEDACLLVSDRQAAQLSWCIETMGDKPPSQRGIQVAHALAKALNDAEKHRSGQ